jgi:UDP-GlcNAc:undecaprenyl-phosphate/decaprenyl-phosphate GlcNAc-1-phosphate transferase
MQIITDFIFFPFLVAFLSTACITPLVIKFAKKNRLVDDPKRSHPAILHTKPVPRGGGIALFIGCFISAIFFLTWTNMVSAVFLASFVALVIGVVDDRLNAQSKDLSPFFRILVNILCAVIVVGSGISVPFITHPFGGILHFDQMKIQLFFGQYLLVSQLVAGLWVIWVMNMLNWSKGVDGIMPGIIVVAAIVIGMLSLRFPLVDQTVLIDAKLSFIIAGSALGFLIYNYYPAKIFPGYGATALYLLLAVVSMLSSAKLATAILVLGVPTVDAMFTIIRRLASGRSPLKGDRKHLHHLLLQFGWSPKQIALFYWTISAIVGTIALHLQSRSKIFAISMLLVLVGGGLFFLHTITRQKDEKTTS